MIKESSLKCEYFYNEADHAFCDNKFKDATGRGVNTTCWQVACGVFLALQARSYVDPGVYTTTDLAKKNLSKFKIILEELSFKIQSSNVELKKDLVKSMTEKWS